MPSERPGEHGTRRGRLAELLRSQGLGVLCGLLVVLLLAVGSVVIASTADGVSRGIHLDDLRAFFEQPSIWHLWFYLLIPVLALYGLNTLLCTWETTLRRWRAGRRAPWHHGPALVHLSFLLLLLAHLIGGIGSQGGRPFRLDARWRMLGDGRDARVLSLRVDRHPSGQPRQLRAHLELRDDAGRTWRETVAYNSPLVSDAGAQLWLLVTARHLHLVTRRGVERRPVVVLRRRQAPGHPLAFVSVLLLISGVLAMGRRWWQSPRPRGEEG